MGQCVSGGCSVPVKICISDLHRNPTVSEFLPHPTSLHSPFLNKTVNHLRTSKKSYYMQIY